MKNEIPRIFVGTLECGESEFEECCKSVNSQVNIYSKQIVISNLNEYDAHNALWEAWYREKENFDLFVKLDADTILSRPTALQEIFKLFENPEVTGAQILLHDYFTDSLIPGLNVFSKTVKFRNSLNKLFADRSDYNHKKVLKGEEVRDLAPIGWHCSNPSPRQAFHYGLHRALKKQKTVLEKCANAWLKNRDNSRAWALSGAMVANWTFRNSHNYSDKKFEKAFSTLQLDDNQIYKIENFVFSLLENKY